MDHGKMDHGKSAVSQIAPCMTEGEIRRVDLDAVKVTIRHGFI